MRQQLAELAIALCWQPLQHVVPSLAAAEVSESAWEDWVPEDARFIAS